MDEEREREREREGEGGRERGRRVREREREIVEGIEETICCKNNSYRSSDQIIIECLKSQ